MDNFERKEILIDLKEKLLFAEEQRLDSEKSLSLDSVQQRLKEKINGKL